MSGGILDVLAFGEVIVDFFPEEQGQRLEDVPRFTRHQGGAPANLAVGLARLGVRSGLMTLVGGDAFGVFLRRALEAEGVDTSAVGTHPTARTGLAFVAVGEGGERSFLFYRHPSADQVIAPGDVNLGTIERTRVFHFGSSTLARPACREATWHALAAARAAGCVVSCDPNMRPGTWEDAAELPGLVRRALAGADVMKIGHDELEILGLPADPAAAARALHAWGPRLVVVTLGADGCWFSGAACGEGHVPGVKVVPVDATGAGDGFWAGFLSSIVPALAPAGPPSAAVEMLDRATVERACRFANRVGALVVTRFGATSALPRKDDPALVSSDDPRA